MKALHCDQITEFHYFFADKQHDLPGWTGAQARGHPQQFKCEIPHGFDVRLR